MIKCLGSGSKGNGWVIDDGGEILIVDCGVHVRDVLIAIHFEISRVVGCAVTHEHSDHAGYIREYEKRGLKTFCPYEQRDVPFQTIQMGHYTIKTFPLVHSVPCYGFLITTPTGKRILYATDTEYIKYRFKHLDAIIVEANYSTELLDEELDDTPKRNHVLRGHMELATTQRFLQLNCDEYTRNVILTHLSNENADRDVFLTKTSPMIEPPVWIAKKGLVVN